MALSSAPSKGDGGINNAPSPSAAGHAERRMHHATTTTTDPTGPAITAELINGNSLPEASTTSDNGENRKMGNELNALAHPEPVAQSMDRAPSSSTNRHEADKKYLPKDDQSSRGDPIDEQGGGDSVSPAAVAAWQHEQQGAMVVTTAACESALNQDDAILDDYQKCRALLANTTGEDSWDGTTNNNGRGIVSKINTGKGSVGDEHHPTAPDVPSATDGAVPVEVLATKVGLGSAVDQDTSKIPILEDATLIGLECDDCLPGEATTPHDSMLGQDEQNLHTLTDDVAELTAAFAAANASSAASAEEDDFAVTAPRLTVDAIVFASLPDEVVAVEGSMVGQDESNVEKMKDCASKSFADVNASSTASPDDSDHEGKWASHCGGIAVKPQRLSTKALTLVSPALKDSVTESGASAALRVIPAAASDDASNHEKGKAASHCVVAAPAPRLATRAMTLISSNRRFSFSQNSWDEVTREETQVPKYIDKEMRATRAMTLISHKRNTSYSSVQSHPVFDVASDCHSDTFMEVSNECYICFDGGELILCDYCPKAFHMGCHIPRLTDIPQGKWKCCECSASSFSRKQRCGECENCLKLNCGECGPCQSMMQFGGDGKYGKPCRLKQCHFMRLAATEQKVTNDIITLKRAHGEGQAADARRGNQTSNSPAKAVTAKQTAKQNSAPSTTMHRAPLTLTKKPPPGPKWTPKLVLNGPGSTKALFHWFSPVRSIQFRRWPQACEFELLRKRFRGNEVRAWDEYRKMKVKAGDQTNVISPSQYDIDPNNAVNSTSSHSATSRALINIGTATAKKKEGKTSNVTSAQAKKAVSRKPSQTSNASSTPAKSAARKQSHTASVAKTRAKKAVARSKHQTSYVSIVQARKPPPGPGWTSVLEQGRFHWISPIRKIEFVRWQQACEFEKLREKFQGDGEVQAWAEYSKMKTKVRGHIRVINPRQYDLGPNNQVNSTKSHTTNIRITPAKKIVTTKQIQTSDALAPLTLTKKRPPGPGWTPKLEKNSGQNRYHWVSPTRGIEFRRWAQACEFEKLRKRFDDDEVQAWVEYRKMKMKKSNVINASQYDVGTYDLDPNNEPNSTKSSTTSPSHGLSVTSRRALINDMATASSKKNKTSNVTSAQAKKTVSRKPSQTSNASITPAKNAARKQSHTASVTKTRAKKAVARSKHQTSNVSIVQAQKPPPGPGWTSVLGQGQFHWISPIRKIEFVRRPQACEFEKLIEEQGDEWKAWAEYRKSKVRGLTRVIEASQYDVDPPNEVNSIKRAAINPSHNVPPGPGWVPSHNVPPGPGWIHKLVVDGGGNYRHHWISPTRKIEFQSRGPALEFEALRKRFNGNEVQAWERYRQIKDGVATRVVSPYDYDNPDGKSARERILYKHQSAAKSTKRKSIDKASNRSGTKTFSQRSKTNGAQCSAAEGKKNPPGPGWVHKLVADGGGNNRHHWISPMRKIEFRSRGPALEFEALRKRFNGNEVQAWERYRQIKDGVATHVVSPYDYDNPDGKSARERILGGDKHQSAAKSTKRRKIDKSSSRSGAKALGQRSKTNDGRSSSAARKRNSHILQVEEPTESNLLASPFNTYPKPSPENGFNCSQVRIVLTKKKLSFFNECFADRVCVLESSLKGSPPEKDITHDGLNYTLASAKVTEDNKSWCKHEKIKKIELLYVQDSKLQKKLQEICRFSIMRPEKIVARLAHLQSECKQVLYINQSQIEFIKEEGHEGCGFYPENHFKDAGGRKRFDAIQVRIVGAKVGFAKGMLLKKRGITCIQIPSSMLKAPSSETSDTGCLKGLAAVVITNNFPSEANKKMGRLLDPDLPDPPPSWMNEDKKPLSDMYKRMLIGFGVEEKCVNLYTRDSKRNPHKTKHVHLKGVVDPTGKLPENKVFISGYTTDNEKNRKLFGYVHKKIYVSRSPCLNPEDAKIVSVVGSKPKEMSTEDWDLLCSYDFGMIIFSQSKSERSTPLPCVIADGDLDGDDYFVLWDGRILDHLLHSKSDLSKRSRKDLYNLALPNGVVHTVNKHTQHPYAEKSNRLWLRNAQDLMLDFSAQDSGNNIIGMLYGLCREKSKDKKSGTIDIYNKDAIAFGRAFKDSLDVQKHGGKIYLPEHLHEAIKPMSLREYLTSDY